MLPGMTEDTTDELRRELAHTRAALAIVETNRPGVWLWEDGGANDIESLSCPVVMSADTCRELCAIEAAHSVLHTCITELLTTSARMQMAMPVVEKLRDALERARVT